LFPNPSKHLNPSSNSRQWSASVRHASRGSHMTTSYRSEFRFRDRMDRGSKRGGQQRNNGRKVCKVHGCYDATTGKLSAWSLSERPGRCIISSPYSSCLISFSNVYEVDVVFSLNAGWWDGNFSTVASRAIWEWNKRHFTCGHTWIKLLFHGSEYLLLLMKSATMVPRWF
jgi:hypothetical protein